MTGHVEKFGRCDCGNHLKRGRTECAACRWKRRRRQAKNHKGAKRSHLRRNML